MNKKLSSNSKNIIAFLFLFLLVIIVFPPDSIFEFVNRIIFFSCVFLGVLDRNLFGPFVLFSITTLSILIYDIKYSSTFLLPLTTTTEIVIVSGNLSFIFGLLVTKIALPKIKQTRDDNFIAKKEIYIVLFIGLLPSIIGTLISLPQILSGQLLQAKENFALPIIGLFSLFKYLALVMSFSYGNKKLIIKIGILIILSLILNISKFEIGLLVTSILVPLIKYRYINLNRKGLYKLIPIVVLIFTLFLFIFDYYNTIRIKASLGEGFDLLSYYYENGKIDSSVPRFLALPLMYFLTPWTNLNYVVETLPNFTNGLWTLKPLVSLFQLDLLFNISYVDKLQPYSSSFNTFSYLSVIFSDFGILGAIIIPFILGIYIYSLYSLYLRSNNPFNVTIYIFNAYAVLLMFFSNHFFMLSYPFIIIILIGIYRLFRPIWIK